ncbi:MAG: type IX secretion system sortase PorU [Bacteroidales bacterium]|nr:type IX secretion system sortase PorU [Bacteroidales bacterium]
MTRLLITLILSIISLSAVSQSLFSSGNWYRLQIGCNGIYRISHQKLKSLGFSNPDNVRIFGFGSECKILHRDGYVYFYAQGPDAETWSSTHQMYLKELNTYTDHSCYFITDINTQYNNRIESASCSGASATETQGTFSYHHEQNINNLQMSGQRWFGEKFNYSFAHKISFSCNSAPTSARLAAAFAARSVMEESFMISAADTRSTVKLAPTSDKGPYATTQSATLNYTPENTENQTVEISFIKNSASGTGYIDYVALETTEKLSYKGKQLIFRSMGHNNGSIRYKVENLVGQHIVMDVSGGTPYIIEHREDGYFCAASDNEKKFAICAPGDALEPIYDGKVEHQDLHGATSTEYIIVTPEKLLPYARQIADLHSDLNCLIATDQQIYNEYSSGMRAASAIRDFARDIYRRGGRLRYLLLFGDGSADNLHNTANNTNKLPTYQSANSLNENGLQSFVSDDYFGLLDDYDGEINGKLRIGVGRIPVNTESEAEVAVEKLRRYKSLKDKAFCKRIAMVADDENQNLHATQAENLSEMIEEYHPEFDISKIYLDSYRQESSAAGNTYPAARADLIDCINNGALIINYIGHGGMRFFADERVLTIEDIDALENHDRLPVMITASCNIGHFDCYDFQSDQATQSPAERLMLNPKGGAIAMLTTTREVSASENHTLHKNIMAEILNIGTRLGDVIMRAKNATNDRNMLNFVLLGDPALELAVPEHRIEATHINGIPIGDFDDTLRAMGHYTIDCKILGGDFDRGTAYITVYDKMLTRTTLNNDGEGAMEFSDYGNTIFKGKSTLNKGRFSFGFTVPKDINYTCGNIKISLYAENGETSASGFNKSLTLGGSSSNVSADCEGPEIFLKSVTEADGERLLIIGLSDKSGINVTAASEHGITVTDTESGKHQDITKLYEPDADSHTSGTVAYRTGQLGEGVHTILIKAWDNMNNPGQRELKIAVTNSNSLKIMGLRVFPNPCNGNATIDFAHNGADGSVEYSIRMANMQGKTAIVQEGTLENSDNQIHISMPEGSANGMYLIRLYIRDKQQRKAEAGCKLLYIR